MRLILVALIICMVGANPGVAVPNPSGAAGSSEIVEWDLAIVLIDRQCQADPEIAYIEAHGSRWSPEKRYQVLWIAEKNEGDLVIITPKPPQEQDPENMGRGVLIASAFEKGYWIPGSKNAVSSGLPKLPAGVGSLAWRYDIEIRDAEGKVLCKVDPVICIKDGRGPLVQADPVCP